MPPNSSMAISEANSKRIYLFQPPHFLQITENYLKALMFLQSIVTAFYNFEAQLGNLSSQSIPHQYCCIFLQNLASSGSLLLTFLLLINGVTLFKKFEQKVGVN